MEYAGRNDRQQRDDLVHEAGKVYLMMLFHSTLLSLNELLPI